MSAPSSHGTPACPDREVLAAFALGRLGHPHERAVFDHLEGCPACQATLDAVGHRHDELLAKLDARHGEVSFPQLDPSRLAVIGSVIGRLVPQSPPRSPAGDDRASGGLPPTARPRVSATASPPPVSGERGTPKWPLSRLRWPAALAAVGLVVVLTTVPGPPRRHSKSSHFWPPSEEPSPMTKSKRKQQFRVERLEDRFAPAVVGDVWDRSSDWTPGTTPGSTAGNPDAGVTVGGAWQYESVPLSGSLGTSFNPWYTQPPSKLTWDASWFGGAGVWSSGNDTRPAIFRAGILTGLDDAAEPNGRRVPIVRWMNQTGQDITVDVSGSLTQSWVDKGTPFDPDNHAPFEFVMMLQNADGTKSLLKMETREFLERDVPISVSIPALQIPAGASIFYTYRYQGASRPGYISLNDDNLSITLKAFGAKPLATADTAATNKNRSVNIDVLANDQWDPRKLPRVEIVSGPTDGGAVVVQRDQSINYTPSGNFTGQSTFQYRVYDDASDGSKNFSDVRTVTVTVRNPTYLYVNAATGDDANAGTSPSAALKTFDGARLKVRSLPHPLTQAVEVIFADGTYALSQTLNFTAQDSGTADNPVTYRGSTNAVISGGKTLTGLTWADAPGMTGVKRAYVGDQVGDFHTLFVNGTRAVRAREPDVGFYTIVWADPDTTHANNRTNSFMFGDTDVSGYGDTTIGNGSPDILSTWTNLQDVEIVNLSQWNAARMKIQSVDAANRVVRVQGAITAGSADYLGDYGMNKTTGYGDGTARYYVENVLQGLDTAGEWYFDRVNKYLYYKPLTGEFTGNTANVPFAVPVLNQLLTMTDTANVLFNGFTFAHTDWDMPASGKTWETYRTPLNQVSSEAAIFLNHTSHVGFSNGRVIGTGFYGIQTTVDATYTTVVNETFADNGNGGILIGLNPDSYIDFASTSTNENERLGGSVAAYDRIALNQFYGNNKVWAGGAAIQTTRLGYSQFTGNTISNTPYAGIAVGWFDGDPYAQGHNLIAWNTITNPMKFLYDGAGIYVIGHQPDTVVIGNTITGAVYTANHLYRGGSGTAGPVNAGLVGIYADESSRGMRIVGNTIASVNQGIFLHNARDIVVESNIIADAQHMAFKIGLDPNALRSAYTKGIGQASSGTVWIASNVIAWTKPLLDPDVKVKLYYHYTNVPVLPYAFDSNVYSFGPLTEAANFDPDYSLTKHQTTILGGGKHDLNSEVTTSPLFVDPTTNNYRILVSAQALVKRKGFTADWLFEEV
jgi:parallel beta-helix repeat protein